MDEEEVERPLGFLPAGLWCVVAGLSMLLVCQLLDALRPGAASDPWVIVLSRVIAVSLAVFGIARVHEPEGSLRELVGITRPRPVHLVIAVFAGLALCVGLEWIDELLALKFPSQEIGEGESLVNAPIARRVAFAIAMGIVKPACDEVFYRGALFTGLKKARSTVDAACAVTVLAALTDPFVFGDLRVMILAFAFAAASTTLRAISGSIIVTYVLNLAFSIDVIAVMLRPTLIHLKVPHAIGGSALAVAVLAIVAAWLVSRKTAESAADA